MNVDPVYLDTRQAADLLGKSQAWLARERWAGSGPPFYKLGRHVRYLKSDLIAWVEAHRYVHTAQYENRKPRKNKDLEREGEEE
jgi:predicted DNA-binding transcriptional regulator AlpA